MLNRKKILLGITGSIAAYKANLLVRQLVKEGAEVKIILTPAAKDFVSPLTLATLSKNKVFIDLFEEDTWANHVMLGRWADVMLIAPLSCNTLAKMASGLCDNLLLATYLSAICPVVVAPAMDEDMWHHPSTKKNLDIIQTYGNKFIPVETGELASGLFGDGRMAEPEKIIQFLKDHFFLEKDFNGKKVLITAGPTYEAIDPVRFISNHSSGKMGIALADELSSRGAEVFLVLGPSSQKLNDIPYKVIRVINAEEMYSCCMGIFPGVDIAIMSAAVADYTPVAKAKEKIKKQNGALNIELTKTKDILKSLGDQKKTGQLLVGFALETENEISNAKKKLRNKNADLVVLNSLKDDGAGFGYETNKVTIFGKAGKEWVYGTKSKKEVAADIADIIKQIINE